jgi:hypothetical protein
MTSGSVASTSCNRSSAYGWGTEAEGCRSGPPLRLSRRSGVRAKRPDGPRPETNRSDLIVSWFNPPPLRVAGGGAWRSYHAVLPHHGCVPVGLHVVGWRNRRGRARIGAGIHPAIQLPKEGIVVSAADPSRPGSHPLIAAGPAAARTRVQRPGPGRRGRQTTGNCNNSSGCVCSRSLCRYFSPAFVRTTSFTLSSPERT